MKVVVVPNHVSDAINQALVDAFEGHILTAEEYEVHYNTLLNYYDQHGIIPEFTVKRALASEGGEK